jgi:hypothetical protein
MALFQLDPESIAARVRAVGGARRVPTLVESITRGVLGFTCVSIAGFLPWPIFELWFRGLREMHLYVACTAMFIGLSGVCLHKLILGPGSLSRFYKLFTLAFLAYAAAWVAGWVTLSGDAGSIAGLLAGTAAMGAILCVAFDAPRRMPAVIAALFVLNTLGYYAGDWMMGKLIGTHRVAAMLSWGVGYGIGFGAGLGLAFHLCQTRARALLRDI